MKLRRSFFAATSVLLLNAPASAQQLVPYVTREGDTCPAIAQRLYGSPTRIDVIHTYNTLPSMPHRFPAGRTLNLPRTAPPPRFVSDGEITQIHNNVHAYTPDDHVARRGEPLNRGHRVGTLANSSAVVTLGDERSLQLEENTLVVLLGRYSYQTQRRETAEDTRLESGSLRSQLAALSGRPPPQPVVVQTPAAQVVTNPGETVVSVDQRRETRVAVHSGQAEVSARGRRVVVAAGFGNRTEPGRPPSPPHPLPPRPRWTRTPPRLFFLPSAQTNATVDAIATYAPPEGTPAPAQWRVQLARDERFHQLVVDQRVGPEVVNFEARALVPGSYFLRVRAIDAERYESAPSEVHPLRIVQPRLRRSVPGVRAAIEVENELFCSLDQGAFTRVSGAIELQPARAHQLRCSDVAEGTNPVSFDVSAADSGMVTALVRSSEVRWSGEHGVRELLVRVMDAAGTPLEGLTPALNWEGSGSAEALVATRETGTYAATVRWSGAATQAHARVAANNTELATLELDAVSPPAPTNIAPAPTPPPRPVEPPVRANVGLGIGILPTLAPLGLGLHAELNGSYRWSFGRFELHVGGAVGYQRFGCSGGTAAPQSYCNQPAMGTNPLRVDVDVLSAGVLARAGFRAASFALPYVVLQPQLVLGRALVVPHAMSEGPLGATFGVYGAAGFQLEARPHAAFLEVGYRYAQLPDARLDALPVGGLLVMLGYRVLL